MGVTAKSVEATLRQHMLTLIDKYADHMKLSPSTVSGGVHGDPRFYGQLLDNRLTFSANTYDRIVANFASEWPAGLEWPEGVPQIPLSEVRVRTRKPRSTPRVRPKARRGARKSGRSR